MCRYMQIIGGIAPDYFASLSDEVMHKASHRRVAVSVDRTLQWLDQCLTSQAYPLSSTALCL